MTYAEAMDRYGSRQTRPAVRPRAGRADRLLRRHPVPGLPGAVRRRRRHARRGAPAAQAARRAGRTGPSSAAHAAWRTCWSGGRRARRAGGQEPLRRPSGPGWPRTSVRRPGDCIFFAAGARSQAQSCWAPPGSRSAGGCGLIDESAGPSAGSSTPRCSSRPRGGPSRRRAVGAGAWTAVHHAFTSPKPEWMTASTRTPGTALAYAYDMVCNGNEIGGGSIRIHRRDVQERVFAVMGLAAGGGAGEVRLPARRLRLRRAAARRHRVRLGPDLRAAGSARDSIREVIAFPKTGGGVRPADRRAGADHAGAAQGGGHRRQAGAGA